MAGAVNGGSGGDSAGIFASLRRFAAVDAVVGSLTRASRGALSAAILRRFPAAVAEAAAGAAPPQRGDGPSLRLADFLRLPFPRPAERRRNVDGAFGTAFSPRLPRGYAAAVTAAAPNAAASSVGWAAVFAAWDGAGRRASDADGDGVAAPVGDARRLPFLLSALAAAAPDAENEDAEDEADEDATESESDGGVARFPAAVAFLAAVLAGDDGNAALSMADVFAVRDFIAAEARHAAGRGRLAAPRGVALPSLVARLNELATAGIAGNAVPERGAFRGVLVGALADAL